MSGIYREVLGSAFDRLRPELRDYFSLPVGAVGTGTGTFARAGCPRPALRPLMRAVPLRGAFFGDYGEQVPFSIENRAHRDAAGRPALTAVRTFRFPSATRIFEDTTTLVAPGRLQDALGTGRRLVTGLALSPRADGALVMDSFGAALHLGPVRVPLPGPVGASARVVQWWDAASGRFRISAEVRQRQLGTVFVYDGAFDYAVG
ncbi:hypothetical protein BN1051_02029 [Arthrobacter saudimassiliensis]|uniref:DUF4166 domain-containing protein n=1 Tax=Arthrobacter saudimassiliensis TaxID=1461584 RepID=A0A078MTF7_9MICC|nr:hypothetical protein BN1051_02029 [Arthrobacter saudimassiliensis]